MNLSDASPLADVQGSADARALPIQKVGVKRLRHPIAWQGKNGLQHSVGEFSFSVYLPADVKGTHMSRFVALLQQHTQPFSVANAGALAQSICLLLDAPQAHFEMRFALFINKTAPVSGVQSMMDYEITLACAATPQSVRTSVTVQVPVTSLCPCSKSVSKYGAHNQRSHVQVRADVQAQVLVEDIITAVEGQASSELFGLLKRTDEKVVTERAYDNPKFVEDLVRDVALAVRALPGLSNISIEAENFESIHNHSAYAILTLE